MQGEPEFNTDAHRWGGWGEDTRGAAGVTPDTCAAIILDAVARRKREVWIGKLSQRLPAHIAQHLPGVYAWLVNHVKSL